MPRSKKPILIAVGNHMIDPNDVACITRINGKDLYVVRLKSQPNMEYPIWVRKNEIDALIEHFNIIVSD
jgi:hypothetical protein